MAVKRKYVDSHWLIFAFEGVIALLFGWFALFNNLSDRNALVAIVGSTLLGLGIVELFNMLRRSHLNETWGFSMISAMLEVATSFTLLFTLNQNSAWHLALIAGYTVVRGLMEILIGFRSVDDRTDKGIWVLIGMCGVIMGFVILNSGNATELTAYIRFFGAYMMLYGLANLIYSLHNHDQKREMIAEYSKIARAREAREIAAKNARRASARKAAAKRVAKKPVARKTTAKKTTRKTVKRTRR